MKRWIRRLFQDQDSYVIGATVGLSLVVIAPIWGVFGALIGYYIGICYYDAHNEFKQLCPPIE